MKPFALSSFAIAAALVPLAATAQAPSCTHTVGMVVSLTGAAGRFGPAAS
jgi:branched-chain amino acid transport system substrate-binding protein